jgi:DNA repair protein RecN (Recombination protein N)
MTTWLESVSIENFGLMRATELALEPGLTVITGESGAGKSLLLSAVDFALGARASSEQIGPFGDRRAVLGRA